MRVCLLQPRATGEKNERKWPVLVTPRQYFFEAQLGQEDKGDVDDSILLQPLSYQLVELITSMGKLYRTILEPFCL